MAKDPAVLFYTADFLTGTILMTDDQVGKYIRLLCIQHQHGPMTEIQMLKITGDKDPDIFGKFVQNEEGKYVNERMLMEAQKRRKYRKSREDNLKAQKPSPHMDSHMDNEDENENKNGDEIGIDKERAEKFEAARKIYPGTKRGFNTEYLNFRKKHKDWRDVVPILEKAIIVQTTKRNRREMNNDFVPDWKHFKTWINNRGWEEDIALPRKTAAAEKRHNSPEVERMMKENYKDPKYDRNKGNSGDGDNSGRQDPG